MFEKVFEIKDFCGSSLLSYQHGVDYKFDDKSYVAVYGDFYEKKQ